MRTGIFSLIANVIASVFIFITLAVIDSITHSGWLIDLSVLTALGAIVAMWLVWALNQLGPSASSQQHQEVKTEKRKREEPSSNDARLALLLQLMDDNERQALKKRLINEMDSDGEAVPLSALLDNQENRRSNR
jgi:type VI protein secretion system component VasK